MSSWVLVVAYYVGVMGKYEANSLAVIPHFTSKDNCEVAGKASKDLASGVKEVKYVCLEVK